VHHFPLVSKKPFQQISQPAPRQNHPPVSNSVCTNNVSGRKHRSRLKVATVIVPASRYPNPSPVAVRDLRRNLEALFCPRLKVIVRKFGELTPLKLLAVS
jgi:hypothetical protein